MVQAALQQQQLLLLLQVRSLIPKAFDASTTVLRAVIRAQGPRPPLVTQLAQASEDARFIEAPLVKLQVASCQPKANDLFELAPSLHDHIESNHSRLKH